MHLFPIHYSCGSKIHQPTYNTYPTNLSKHVFSCHKQERKVQKNHKLASLGISGTGNVDQQEVPQICAVWCAQAAQKFFALGEESDQSLLHPFMAKNLPTRRAVSNNIGQLYAAVQESLIELFKVSKPYFYLLLLSIELINIFYLDS